MDPATTAWWALDVSAALPVIEQVASGHAPGDWAERLVTLTTIADFDINIVHLLAEYGGRERLQDRPVRDFWPPESWSVLADLVVAAVADFPAGAPRSSPTTSIAFRDAVVNISIASNPDERGLVFLSVGGIVEDKRSLWTVRASEQRYRNLIQHLPYPLLQVDAREAGQIYEGLKREGVIDLDAYLDEHPELIDTANRVVTVTEANVSAARLFGAESVDDLIGPVGFVFAASEAVARRVMIARFDGRRSHSEIMKLQTFDGRIRDVEISVTYPQPPERLDVTILSFDDITERLRTEAQLRELQAEFSRAARISMLGELATSIAHEVNQPLSAIVTNAETGLRWLSRPDPNIPKVCQLTSRIADSARVASQIVQRIRGMAVRHETEWTSLRLNQIVEEAILFVRHEIESRSIELSMKLAEDLPAVRGDRVQLQQVIVNLLLNAVQAIEQPEKSGKRIELCTYAEGDGTVFFAIHDSGPGISGEALDHVFDSFFTTKPDGMGIGLAICQSIIHGLGGQITAANHRQGGAVFRLSLPSEPAH